MTPTETLPAVQLIPQEIQNRLEVLFVEAQSYPLATREDVEAAGQILSRFTKARRAIEEATKPECKRRYDHWKEATGQRDDVLQTIARKEFEFNKRVNAKRDELNAEIERQRNEAEAKARKEAEDRKVDLAANLEKNGRTEEAETVLSDTRPPVLATPAPAPVKLNGTATRTYFRARVTDAKALIKAVAAGQVTIPDVVIANQSVLDKFAQATKGQVELPGVVWEKEEKTVSTGR